MEISFKKNEDLIKAYIDKLQWFEVTSEPQEELKGNLKEKGAIDMSDKLNSIGLFREFDMHNETTSILYLIDNKYCGFHEKLYKDFKNMIRSVFNDSIKTISYEETESVIFNWMINFKKSEDFNQNLSQYFKAKYGDRIEEFNFYFPINNLNIESDIVIGEVIFTYFTKEYFDEFFKHSKMPKEHFDGIFRKEFQGEVIAKVKAFGSNERAFQIAKEKALFSVDILKALSITSRAPKKPAVFDLSFRLPFQLQTQYLSKKTSSEFDYTISLNNGYLPMEINNQLIHVTQKDQKEIYNNFLKNYFDSDLNRLIKQSIHLLASAFSTEDIHERVVSMISILESILLEEDREHKLTKKTTSRLKKLLYEKDNSRGRIGDIIDEFYNVRHKMVHKVIKLPIDLGNLVQFQIILIQTINQLIGNTHIANKETLIMVLDEMN